MNSILRLHLRYSFLYLICATSRKLTSYRGVVAESNKFRTDFYQIFRKFFHFSNQSNCKFLNWIKRISNKSIVWKFDSTLLLESNQMNIFRINFHRIFRIFVALSNQTNSTDSTPALTSLHISWITPIFMKWMILFMFCTYIPTCNVYF